MSRNRLLRDEGVKTAAAQAAALSTQRQTCEGCAALRQLRPMCQDPRSQHYRQAIDSYHTRCTWYAVKGQMAKPAPTPEPPPASRAEIGGEVSKRKHNRWKEASA